MVASQLQVVDECEKVLFACGSFSQDSHMARTELLDEDTMQAMRKQGGTGVICGRVIDQDGNPMRSPNEAQMIGVTLDQMRQKDMRILVSAGIDRKAPTRAALLGGYATHLVASSDTAHYLLSDR